MIRPFYARDNAVYVYGADVDWTQIQHIGDMYRWLDDKDIQCYINKGTIYFAKERDRTLFLLKWAEAEELQ